MKLLDMYNLLSINMKNLEKIYINKFRKDIYLYGSKFYEKYDYFKRFTI